MVVFDVLEVKLILMLFWKRLLLGMIWGVVMVFGLGFGLLVSLCGVLAGLLSVGVEFEFLLSMMWFIMVFVLCIYRLSVCIFGLLMLILK